MSTTPPITAPASEPSAAATPVDDKRTAAKGVIPKQMQSWVFLAVVLVVAVGLWFSSSTKPKTSPGSPSVAGEQVKPVVGGLTPDEVQRRLQESEDVRRSAVTNPPPRQAGQATDLRSNDAHLNPDANPLTANQSPADAQAPPRDPIAEDERKREYVGRFASNVALSYRTDRSEPHAAGPPAPSNADALGNSATQAPAIPGLPADFQQQLEALQAQQEKLLAQQQQLTTAAILPVAGAPPPQPAQAAATSPRKNAQLNAATGKSHVIFEGTVLESVLVTRLNGDFAGPVICQISTDLYSHDHTQLLIPAGTRVLGETKKISDVGQARLAVVFHRLIMPDGYSVDLDQAPGLNQIGETALHDKVNNHYFKIFGSSIAVGAIAGLASIGTNNSAVTGLPTSSASAYREGVSGSLSQSSLRILDRFLNIPPTITIREGHRVRIFLTQDLLLPAYGQHKMPSDL
jgi:type IV secretion system protein TrbI